MTRTVRIILASLMFLVSCSQSTPTSSTTPSSEPTISSLPSISIETSLIPHEQLCLNLSASVTEWPVSEAMEMWNQNGDGFKFTYRGNCFTTVTVIAANAGDLWWGETRVTDKRVTLNTSAPVDKRLHIACHELGHLMGIGHTDDTQSCMNINLFVTHPSANDLELAGKNSWLFGE